MKKGIFKILPLLAVTGGFFIGSCGGSDMPEVSKTRQKGEDCDKNNLCMAGLVCESGKCRVLCSGKDDCGPKEHCESSRCVANKTDECPTGFTGERCDQCLPGYWGKDCQECDCSGHGKCNDGLSGNGKCTCESGWNGEKCLECATGYTGQDCNECADEYFGPNCSKCACSEHGTCNQGKEGDGSCNCDTGWSGAKCSECDSEHYGTDCLPCECTEHGRCSEGKNGNGKCTCDQGWEDEKCATETPCAPGFTNAPECNLCQKGFYGDFCNPCECSIHGDCWDGKSGNGLCKGECDVGWAGDKCDRCKDGYATKNCILPTCKNGTPNLGLEGDGHCSQCSTGWALPDCDKCDTGYTGTTNCMKITCDLEHGTLNNETGTCSSCNGNWTGANCETCPNNFTGTNCNQCKKDYYGSSCKNECRCNEHQSCDDGITGQGCKCANGWSGNNCDICKDTDGYGKDCTRYGSVTDLDGISYNTVIINGQTWMAENMAYKTDVSCITNPKDADFINKYGCLYTWDDAQKVCQQLQGQGWHLPEEGEFRLLLTATGANNSSTSLRAPSFEKGSNTSGFGALPAGGRDSDNQFKFLNTDAFFWSATLERTYANYFYVSSNSTGNELIDTNNAAFSVRCLRDSKQK